MPFLGPVVTGIGSVLGGAFSFLSGSTILAGVLKIGLGLAAQYAIGQIFKPDVPAQVSHLQTQYGQDLPRSVVLGTRGLAGHHVYRNAYGKGGRTVQDLYVLSHFRVNAVTRVRYEGQWRTLGGPVDGERGQRIQGIDAEIWVKVYQGDIGQAADAGLVARSNPAGRWTSAHRLAGVAYAVVTQQLDREKLPNTWEAFFEVEGVCYDWRQDSSVGGAGAQRWNDPTTWGPSSNPVIHQYNLERGFWLNNQLIVGKGASTDRLPLGNWTLAANISDEVVGTTKRYTSGYIATAGQGITHAGNMAPLQAACAASWFEGPEGEYPIVGANQAVVATITDLDLLPDEDKSFSRYRTRSELVNTIAGTYASPEAFYDNVPLATRTDAPAFIADRERLATSIPYDAVVDPKVGDRLNDIALRASRYQANAEICLRQAFLKLKVGQWIRWQSDEASGFDKTFQIVRRRLGPIGPKACRAVYLTLQEVGAGIFDPTAYQTTPPDNTGPGAPDFQSELENYSVVGIKMTSESGSERAGLRAQWNDLEDPTITEIIFEYGPVPVVGQVPAAVATAIAQRNATRRDMFEGVMSNSWWAVRYTMRSQPARTFFFSPWVYVKTLPAKLGNGDLYNIDLDALAADTKRLLNWTASAIPDLNRKLDALGALVADQSQSNFDTIQTVRKETASTTGKTRAYVRNQVFVATGPTSALALSVEELRAEVFDPVTGLPAVAQAVSSLSTEVDIIDGKVTLNSTAITALQTSYLDVSASATFRMETGRTPSAGWSAKAAMMTRVDSAGVFRDAGLFLESTPSLARVLITADQFIVVSPSAMGQPLTFIGGVLTLTVGRIQTAIVDLLKTPTNKTQLGVFSGGSEGLRVTV